MRRGFVAVEALVVGALTLMIVQASWSVLAVQLRAGKAIASSAQALDAARVSRLVMNRDIDVGVWPQDWSADDGELRLRAFRGVGRPCQGVSGGMTLDVAGSRWPDARKDSVLVLDQGGYWHRRALASARGGVCRQAEELQGGGRVQRWVLSESVTQPVLAVYFERGAYRFSNETLRYRVGHGGWQPLLPAAAAIPGSEVGTVSRGRFPTSLTWETPFVGPQVWSWASYARRP